MRQVTLYETWEILKDGKHGEVYQVAECAVSDYKGLKAKVTEDRDSRGSFKSLVKADTPSSDKSSNNLIPMYGCIVTAKWEKVEQYSYALINNPHELVRLMQEGKTVYVKEPFRAEYKAVNPYTEFDSLGIADFDDLLSKPFYKKEAI